MKAAPFNHWLVGTYIFLAGLSGGSMLLATLLDVAGPRRTASERTASGNSASGRDGPRRVRRAVGRGRYLSMLAPTVGAALLVCDLHTPRRFYNMLRVFKTTSPMSVGSWLLVSFGALSGATTFAHWMSGHIPGFRWMAGLARVTQVPAAAAGAGIATYTASLLSATSTPLWAAAPAATGVRFGASSVASAAAALSLTEPAHGRTRRDLDLIAVAALALELAAIRATEKRYRETGIEGATQKLSGDMDKTIGTGLGILLPLGLHVASRVLGSRFALLSRVASLATLVGGATMRIAFLASGDDSAQDPSISLRFAQPRNLPGDAPHFEP